MPITPFPDLTVGFNSLDEQNCGRNELEKHNLKDEVLQNLCGKIRETFDSEYKIFKSKC